MRSRAWVVLAWCAGLGGAALAQPTDTGSGSAAPPPVPSPAPITEPIPAAAALPPPAPTPAIAPAPAPSATSRTDVLLVGGAGAALGASLVLFLAARDASSDADLAARYQDHDDLQTRSTRLYITSGLTAGAAVALAVTEYFRIHRSRESSTGIAIAPHAGGGSVVIGGSW